MESWLGFSKMDLSLVLSDASSLLKAPIHIRPWSAELADIGRTMRLSNVYEGPIKLGMLNFVFRKDNPLAVSFCTLTIENACSAKRADVWGSWEN